MPYVPIKLYLKKQADRRPDLPQEFAVSWLWQGVSEQSHLGCDQTLWKTFIKERPCTDSSTYILC